MLPVRAECDTPNSLGMSFQRKGILTCACVPQFHCLVIACRSQNLTIWAESHFSDVVCVTRERQQLLAGKCIPQFHRVVMACRSQTLTIRTESHACDFASVSSERQRLLADKPIRLFQNNRLNPYRCAIAA